MKGKHVTDSRGLIVRTPSTTSVDSQSSTVSANASAPNLTKASVTKNSSKKKERQRKSKKAKGKLSVRFNEDQNEYYDDRVSAEERALQWCTVDDINQFKTLTVQLVQLVTRKEDGKSKGWSACMRKAYGGFCMVNSVQDVEEVISAYRITPMRASRIGLEKWAIRPMVADRLRRREALWELLRTMQDAPYTSEDDKLNKIRVACRCISRPGRLFAHHVAQLSARKILD